MVTILRSFLVLGLLAGQARAHGTIIVESDEPAWVHINGNRVGLTPRTGRWVGHGSHELTLVNARTGETLTQRIFIRDGPNVTHRITGNFPGPVRSFAPAEPVAWIEGEPVEEEVTTVIETRRILPPAPRYFVSFAEDDLHHSGGVIHDEIILERRD